MATSKSIVIFGKQYNSISEASREFGVKPGFISHRIKMGMTPDEAVTVSSMVAGQKKSIDHLGNQFNSQAEMCRYWGVGTKVYRQRVIYRGWTIEKALTTPDNRVGSSVESEDHLKNRYSSFTGMCNKYGLDENTVRARLRNGWTLEKALTTPLRLNEIDKKALNLISVTNIDYKTYKNRVHNCRGGELYIIVSAPPGKQIVPNYIGLDNKAYYKINGDYLTTRQLLEKYKPELLEFYDKDNPTGEYRPYKKAGEV